MRSSPMLLLTRRGALASLAAGLVARSAGATAPRPAGVLAIAGTGAALGTMRRLAAAFAAENPGVRIDLPNSLGTTGGMRAVLAGAIDVATSVRPVTDAEAALGARAEVYGRSPFGFVTSLRAPPDDLTTASLLEIYSLTRRSWPDGTPIRLILRIRRDGDSVYLAERFAALDPVLETLHQRQLVPVAQTDQINLDMAEKFEGSFACSTLSSVLSEQRPLRVLALDGVAPSVRTTANGTYPHIRPLHLVTTPTTSEAGHAFVAFARSARAHAILAECGTVPV